MAHIEFVYQRLGYCGNCDLDEGYVDFEVRYAEDWTHKKTTLIGSVGFSKYSPKGKRAEVRCEFTPEIASSTVGLEPAVLRGFANWIEREISDELYDRGIREIRLRPRYEKHLIPRDACRLYLYRFRPEWLRAFALNYSRIMDVTLHEIGEHGIQDLDVVGSYKAFEETCEFTKSMALLKSYRKLKPDWATGGDGIGYDRGDFYMDLNHAIMNYINEAGTE